MVGFGYCGFRDVEVPEVSKITDTEKQSVLLRMPEYSFLITGAQVGAISPSRGHLACLEMILVVIMWKTQMECSR